MISERDFCNLPRFEAKFSSLRNKNEEHIAQYVCALAPDEEYSPELAWHRAVEYMFRMKSEDSVLSEIRRIKIMDMNAEDIQQETKGR